MPTNNIDIDGYKLFHADRKKVGKTLYANFDEKPELIPQDLECICGEVTFPNKHNIIVAKIYGPPNEKINWFDKMDKILGNFSNTKLEFIINGDLNCDMLKQPLENHSHSESHQLTQLVLFRWHIKVETVSIVKTKQK